MSNTSFIQIKIKEYLWISKSSDAWTKANKHKQNLHMLTHVHVKA